MTEQEIKIKLSKQVNPGEEPMNPKLFTIKSVEPIGENYCAIKIIFDYEWFTDMTAIIYEQNDVCFTAYDWEIPEDDKWFDHEHQVAGIMLNDLPRVF